MAGMGMGDMVGEEGMEGEVEVGVVDSEVVGEDSEGDGRKFDDNVAYLLAFRTGPRNNCIMNAIKRRNQFRTFQQRDYSSKTSYSKSPLFSSYSGKVAGPQAPVPNP